MPRPGQRREPEWNRIWRKHRRPADRYEGRPIRCRPGGPPAPKREPAAAGGRRGWIAPGVNFARSKKACRDHRRAWISTVVRRRHGAAVTNSLVSNPDGLALGHRI